MALTQADLARLEAEHEAVQKELYNIVTKRGVSAAERAADNARIDVLNKRAADIVKQQRSATLTRNNTTFNPSNGQPYTQPAAQSTIQKNLTPQATQAVEFFESKGWTNAQASGIVANLQAESGVNLNPKAVGDAGAARGIAQWQGSRQANFEKFAGKPLSQATREEQLAFVNYELTEGTEKGAGARLKDATTPGQAATIVDKYYERSAGLAGQKRIDFANNLASGTDGGDPLAPTLPKAKEEPSEEYIIDPRTGKKVRVAPLGTKSDFGMVQNSQVKDQAARSNPDLSKPEVPLENPLHQYPSYSYSLSLHLLSATEYNEVMLTESYVPKRVLIASAGRYNTTNFVRSPYFNEDFFFDDFILDTAIAPTEQNRNTNSVQMAFKIIEPHGFTLIERLIRASMAKDVASSNYLDNPYVLQIDFFAYNNAGEIVGALPEHTKRIPIMLRTLSAKVSGRGSEYSVTAAAFGHTAFDHSYAKTPANFEVVAATVAGFFQTDEVAIKVNSTEVEREIANQSLWRNSNGGYVYTGSGTGFAAKNEVPPLLTGGRQSADTFYKAYSYGAAINAFNKKLYEKNKIQAYDEYRFEFDPIIGNSKIAHPKWLSNESTRMLDPRNAKDLASAKQGDTGQNTTGFDPNARIFSINAGTMIDRVIDLVIRQSDYILSQLVVPEDYGDDVKKYQEALKANNGPLKWFKIIPRIELLEFDKIRNVWARRITLYVKSYQIKNVPMDMAPSETARYPLKKYEYIYTGHNSDIIDFDLKFDMMYYNWLTAYRDSLADLTNIPADGQTDKDSNVGGYAGALGPGEDRTALSMNAVMPMVMRPHVLDSRARATAGGTSTREAAAADLESFVISKVDGDMVRIKLKILGDPQFIKQDDIFYAPKLNTDVNESKQSSDPRLTSNGSIRTDDGLIYVNIQFKTPIDVDESTGLMTYKTDMLSQSVFSGLYQIVTIRSEFSKGRFIQELSLARLPRQDEDDFNKANKSTSAERNSENEQLSLPPAVEAPNTTIDNTAGTNTDTGDAQTTGQQQTANNTTEEISPPTDQAKLIETGNTANTQPVTSQTAPQAVVTPPDAAKVSQLREKVRDLTNDISVLADTTGSTTRSVNFMRNSATAFDSETAKMRQAIIDATASFGADAPIIKDFERTIERNEKAKAERNKIADQYQAQLDSARAELASVQSQLNILTGN